MRKDWSVLLSRIRTVEYKIITRNKHLNFHLHYPALRDAKATIDELVEVISMFLTHFSLPRKRIEAVYATLDATKTTLDWHQAIVRLESEARSLFIRARRSSQRTGEVGELLLYIFTEWLLEAPQIIAKMSLKTSAQMPVHGSDGIHVRFDEKTNRLILFSGEAKLHKDVSKAITSAVASIRSGLTRKKMQHEIELVQRHIDFSGLGEAARKSLLRYLDPFDDSYNDRLEVITCLIGFDFSGYANLRTDSQDDPDTSFKISASAKLKEVGPAFAKALADAGHPNQRVELFLFPVPSVSVLRDLFQDRIGWTRD